MSKQENWCTIQIVSRHEVHYRGSLVTVATLVDKLASYLVVDSKNVTLKNLDTK